MLQLLVLLLLLLHEHACVALLAATTSHLNNQHPQSADMGVYRLSMYAQSKIRSPRCSLACRELPAAGEFAARHGALHLAAAELTRRIISQLHHLHVALLVYVLCRIIVFVVVTDDSDHCTKNCMLHRSDAGVTACCSDTSCCNMHTSPMDHNPAESGALHEE